MSSLGTALSDMRKESDYKDRTQRVLLFRGGTKVEMARLGGLRYHEERFEKDPQYLDLAKARIVKGRSFTKPAMLALSTIWWKLGETNRRIRKPKAADVRKYERLTQRIADLQRQRRELLVEAFERADVVPVEKWVAAAEKNVAIAKAGFRANARVPRV